MEKEPRILVFSTNNISDPGIDLAGSAHRHYSPAVDVIAVSCSSAVKTSWIIHALESGFDGVFIAACGGDCSYLQNCTTLTGDTVARAHVKMKSKGLETKRLKMAAICSVCAEPFVNHMNSFKRDLEKK